MQLRNITNILFYFPLTGQHLKKNNSLSESSSDMMDLEDGIETTPNIGDQNRMVPFYGTHLTDKQQLQQQQNCCKQPSNGGGGGVGGGGLPGSGGGGGGGAGGGTNNNLQQRHNSALAVSIETDV